MVGLEVHPIRRVSDGAIDLARRRQYLATITQVQSGVADDDGLGHRTSLHTCDMRPLLDLRLSPVFSMSPRWCSSVMRGRMLKGDSPSSAAISSAVMP